MSRALLAVGLAFGLLTACSGAPASVEQTSATPSPTAPETAGVTETTTEPVEPYLPVPEDVELTEPGTALELTEPATVAWEAPDAKKVSVARIKILSFERAKIGVLRDWKLNKENRKATPYFVRARVTNLGDGGLGGQAVPLYAQAPDNVLVAASSFKGQFGPCSPAQLPTQLPPGDKAVVCLVYLLPDGEQATGVSFYPELDAGLGFAPIHWDGEATRFRPGA